MPRVPGASSFFRTRCLWKSKKSRILSSAQYLLLLLLLLLFSSTPPLRACAKKAWACSSSESPCKLIKSKNSFNLLGYCLFVKGDLMEVNANATGVVCLVVINGDDEEEEVEEEGTDDDEDDDCKQFLHPHIFHQSGC